MIRVHETTYFFASKMTDTVCFNLDDMEQFYRYAQPNADEVWHTTRLTGSSGANTATVKVANKRGDYDRVIEGSPVEQHRHCDICEKFFDGVGRGNGTGRVELDEPMTHAEAVTVIDALRLDEVSLMPDGTVGIGATILESHEE